MLLQVIHGNVPPCLVQRHEIPLCPFARDISISLETNIHIDDMVDILHEVNWEQQVRAYQRLPNLKTLAFSAGTRASSKEYSLDPLICEVIASYLAVLLPRQILRFQ